MKIAHGNLLVHLVDDPVSVGRAVIVRDGARGMLELTRVEALTLAAMLETIVRLEGEVCI